LGQILSNLIGNALKFITEGQVIVEARLLKDKASSCEVQFSITDTGPGISQETVELIFKDYEQLQCSHLANQTGAGLGLGICKYLVELLGGKIWVESEIAKGSIFYFTVELEKAKSSAEIKPQYLLPTEKYSNMKLLKILLAEDATINQKFLCHFLTEQGHKVVPVQNGKEALSALEMENFDLVLMDVQMPEMDGVEATKRIREATSKQIDPNIPIIALTAYAMQEDKERFLQAGMNDYISKPLDMDKLLTVINKIADTKKMDTPGELQYSKTSSNSNQAINMEVLLSTYPPHFIRKMLQVFLDSADKTLAEIDEAIRTEEHALAEKRLHSLAGTAAIMKATSLKRKSRNLMQLAREQDTASLKNKFSELDGEMKKVTEFIRQLPLLKN
jgi:CheY-like chemotaxis protein